MINQTVAVLGAGIMGSAITRNLANKGYKVKVWNRTYSKAQPLIQENVQIFHTVAEAVSGAGFILTMLNDGSAVASAISAGAGSFTRGAIWLQMSTVGVDECERLAGLAARHHLSYYDAPVQGTRQPAEQAQLIIMASGPLTHREAIQPLFDAIGKRTLWLAEHPGTSSRLKLALNSWAFALTHGLAESLALAKGLGVDPARVIDVVSGGPMDCGYFQLKGAAMLAGNYDPAFTIANAVKDSRLVVEAAARAGVDVRQADAGYHRFQQALAAGHGDKDMAASFLL